MLYSVDVKIIYLFMSWSRHKNSLSAPTFRFALDLKKKLHFLIRLINPNLNNLMLKILTNGSL